MSKPQLTAIVRRGDEATFDHLAGVVSRVRWDRRVADRRTRHGWIPLLVVERRHGERRRPPPASWVEVGFLIAWITDEA